MFGGYGGFSLRSRVKCQLLRSNHVVLYRQQQIFQLHFDSNLKDFVFGFDFGQSLAEKGDGEEALIRGKDETDVKVHIHRRNIK